MVLVDTSVILELLRSEPESTVEAWLAGQRAEEVFLSAVSEAELHAGVESMPAGRRQRALATAVNGILTEDFRNRIVAFDSAAARAFAEIAAARCKAGRPISQSDCQIAAIARACRAAVATRNVRDLEGCGIELVNPWRMQ